MSGDVDVLVVGAGPTGLVLAGELARRGVRVRLVDKNLAPTTQSRAVGVHARTLEIFDELGIADELVARGVPVGGITMSAGGKPLVEIEFEGLASRFPFVLCVSQVETETVLHALLERRGGAVERGKELVSFSQDARGIEAVLRGTTGDERVRASWIVGCDGAHSAVRHSLGATFSGHTYEDTFVLADAALTWELAHDHVWTFIAEDGVAAFFPLPGDRWRVIASAAGGQDAEPTLAAIRTLVERRAGRSVPLRDAAWTASFKIHCRQVERYRHGRAFLAGDAAHIHSPVGGQGMNTGIQDAHNLAWKLALVVHGRAGDALLDSYHAERHAIGHRVLAQTDLATKVGTLKGVLAPVRNQLLRFITSFEPVRRKIVRDASQITVAYPGSPIVGEAVGSFLGARVGRTSTGETPTLGSHRAFAAGPLPGSRALDGECVLVRGSERTPTRLARVVDGDAFTLLLFDGKSPSAAGYETLSAIARRVRDRYGAAIATFVVTPRGDRPSELPPDLAVLLDRAGALEDAYGAATECLYLVRPELYIGFRSQPANGDALDAHLAAILTSPASSSPR